MPPLRASPTFARYSSLPKREFCNNADLARDQQGHGKIEGMEGMNRKEGHAAAPVRMLSTDVDSALPRIRLPVKGGAPRLPQAVV